MSYSVLLVDDDLSIREHLQLVLEAKGYTVTEASNGEEALEELAKTHFDFALLDLIMPGMSGLDVLQTAARSDGPLFIVLTSLDDTKTAVECMRAGAYDYLTKPIDSEELLVTLERASKTIQVREEVNLLRKGMGERFGEMIGWSTSMRRVYQLIQRAAQTPDTTILVTGESGTGKELVARAIHRESNRSAGAFVPVNCTAVQETLLESEFFGHEKGAFTDAHDAKKGLLEVADGGTIFLDEIGDMTETLQAKLLRFLEDHTFRRLGGTRTLHSDVRVIAATNRHLESLVADGGFREDLFYRLNVFPIALPPLRERLDDIPLLASFFLEEYCTRMSVPVKRFSPPAVEALNAYNWPGNVRELRNLVERLVILHDTEELQLRHLPREIVPQTRPADFFDDNMSALPYNEAKRAYMDEFTRNYVSLLLDSHDGNVTRSAEKAQMDRANFQRLMRKVGLSAKEYNAEKKGEDK